VTNFSGQRSNIGGGFHVGGTRFWGCKKLTTCGDAPQFVFRPVILASIKKAASQLNVVGPQVRKF
jgi:hypothetical protein